ncbi:MAG: SDR family NAD(P)-dependent oxidoreductase [Janthinobacterium lividum]
MFAGEFMQGRVALVTGGGGGIGSAVVEALAAHGAHVIAADITAAKRSIAAPAHARIESMALDVCNRVAVQDAVQDIVARHGRLDILVNVAGVVSVGSAEHLSEQEWDRVIAINLKGTFLCCQAVIGQMKSQQFGRIVNMGSVVGKNAGNARPWRDPAEQARAGNIVYGISKAGVHVMTAFLAKELAASGVTVNAVAPGPVASSMTTDFPQTLRDLIPVGRMGQAREIAQAVVFLAASDTSFITGETLDVNGGIWCD